MVKGDGARTNSKGADAQARNGHCSINGEKALFLLLPIALWVEVSHCQSRCGYNSCARLLKVSPFQAIAFVLCCRDVDVLVSELGKKMHSLWSGAMANITEEGGLSPLPWIHKAKATILDDPVDEHSPSPRAFKARRCTPSRCITHTPTAMPVSPYLLCKHHIGQDARWVSAQHVLLEVCRVRIWRVAAGQSYFFTT